MATGSVREWAFSRRAHPAAKVCGLTRQAEVLAAAAGGAWAVGFVMAASPRRVTVERAAELVRALREHYPVGTGPLSVGVFVDEAPEAVAAAVRIAGLDAVQFHGKESPDDVARTRETVPEIVVIKAMSVDDTSAEASIIARARSYAPVVDAVLLDTRVRDRVGGTGTPFRWLLARGASRLLPVLVAGGIGPDNAAGALEESHAWGVDASSGLELEPGVKDAEMITRFLQAVAGIRAGEVRAER